MKDLKTKSVAILSEPSGLCKKIFVCTHVSEEEYKKLVNEMRIADEKEKIEKQLLLDEIKELKDKVESLEHEIKVLKGEDENE